MQGNEQNTVAQPEEKPVEKTVPLTCERRYIYVLLMICAGMMGAYTYNLRGGVFCNAQTANVVVMALGLGKGDWTAFYYLIPICAYALGAFVSEILPTPLGKAGVFRWETVFVIFEILVLFGLGFVPVEGPLFVDRIVQVTINFIASMQYNTFRKSQGMAMATTFCTNHVRMIGVNLAKFCQKRTKNYLFDMLFHILMIALFCLAGILLTFLCSYLGSYVIWIAIIPLLVVAVMFIRADLAVEKGRLLDVPAGH